MAISHLSSGEVTSIRPLGNELDETSTNAFFKDDHLEVMRIFLRAEKHIPAHAVDGPITVQCIEGEVDVITGDTHVVIRSADLLYLAAGVVHELVAIRNSCLLVTIALLRASRLPRVTSETHDHHDDDASSAKPS